MTPAKSQRSWSAPLADFIERAIDPLVAKRGFGGSDVVLHWEEIVGRRLAEISRPLRLAWAPRGTKRDPFAAAEPASLVLQVEGAFALEIQHLAPVILERVNAHLGWRCVGRLQIRQGPVVAPKPALSKAPLDEGARARAIEASASIEDTQLREALTRLGTMALSRTVKKGSA